MPYPVPIEAAVGHWLGLHGSGPMRAATAAIHERYRVGGSSAAVDVSAYLTSRAPATYASISRALHNVALALPDFAPETMLDVGAGPGTASWAAFALWPGLGDILMLDQDERFLAAATEIAARAGLPARTAAASITSFEAEPAKLVIASYVLAELGPGFATAIAARLWRHTAHTLVIVEPGTPRGFERLRAVRTELLRLGSNIVAPCPHAASCPMTPQDWCHFSVRLPRTREHMHAKGASVPFEDEPFSYLAVSRHPAQLHPGRLLRPPVETKSGLALTLCTQSGMHQMNIVRRDKVLFKRLRKLRWGDSLKEIDHA
jgi:ribosomal protein RSM22 (predicted rRNA methylase)